MPTRVFGAEPVTVAEGARRLRELKERVSKALIGPKDLVARLRERQA